MKLIGYEKISGIIYCETGLRIGGTEDIVEIGGIENVVIKNPLTGYPYIPGSSIKGKMRFLLEWFLPDKLDTEKGNVHSCDNNNCPICLIFGKGAKEKSKTEKSETEENSNKISEIKCPTLAIFRDADLILTPELEKLKREKGLPYVENKTENVINRIYGKAEHPRTMERVPAGSTFKFEIAIRNIEGIKLEYDLPPSDYILAGLYLISQDALGGSGSRGYGYVSFFPDEKSAQQDKNCVMLNNYPVSLKEKFEKLDKKLKENKK